MTCNALHNVQKQEIIPKFKVKAKKIKVNELQWITVMVWVTESQSERI